MYAVKGNSFRAVDNSMQIETGETLCEHLPETFGQPTQTEIIALTDKAIETWLDGFVQQRNYKSIESCIGWLDDEDPFFAAEALAAKRWRSAVYRAARTMLLNPPAGVTPENILQHLPQPEEFDWPVAMVGPIGAESTPSE